MKKFILETHHVSKENTIQQTDKYDNYQQSMPFNIYFNNNNNPNDHLNNQQLQGQGSYSAQNNQNNVSYDYYQSTNSLNQFSYSDITTINSQITSSSSGISSLNTNEYTTSDTTLYSQIPTNQTKMQSNWNDETPILDSICPVNITYLPSFSTFFK